VASPKRVTKRKRDYKTVVFATKFRKVRGEDRNEYGDGILLLVGALTDQVLISVGEDTDR
jgi:hypothetical protein